MGTAATDHHGSSLRLALGLDGLALGALLVAVVLIESQGGSQGTIASVLAGLAFTVAIAAGVIATRALVRRPPSTRAGRWAVGLAIAYVASLPVIGLLTIALDLEPGWAEAAVRPALMLFTGLGAILLGVVASEPGRRGLLFIPLMIGASALLFILGDLIFPE